MMHCECIVMCTSWDPDLFGLESSLHKTREGQSERKSSLAWSRRSTKPGKASQRGNHPWLAVVAPQNQGRPVREEIIPGLQSSLHKTREGQSERKSSLAWSRRSTKPGKANQRGNHPWLGVVAPQNQGRPIREETSQPCKGTHVTPTKRSLVGWRYFQYMDKS